MESENSSPKIVGVLLVIATLALFPAPAHSKTLGEHLHSIWVTIKGDRWPHVPCDGAACADVQMRWNGRNFQIRNRGSRTVGVRFPLSKRVGKTAVVDPRSTYTLPHFWPDGLEGKEAKRLAGPIEAVYWPPPSPWTPRGDVLMR